MNKKKQKTITFNYKEERLGDERESVCGQSVREKK